MVKATYGGGEYVLAVKEVEDEVVADTHKVTITGMLLKQQIILQMQMI